METDNDIERQIKELERDKRLEEIKQLRADAKTRWITPAFLIALLPILGTFMWWIFEQAKDYSEVYQKGKAVGALSLEKEALKREKDSLNIEISKLFGQRSYYADEAERLQQETRRLQREAERLQLVMVAKQDVLDKMYLRGTYAMREAQYALGLGGNAWTTMRWSN
jgi:hypothetical protein